MLDFADARGFDDDEVEAGRLHGQQHLGQGLGLNLASEVARGQRAHEHTRPKDHGRDRIHAYAVAEQRAAALCAATDRWR